MNNWKVGDRCIIDCFYSSAHGQETTIISIDEEGFEASDGGSFVGAGVDISHSVWKSGHAVFMYKHLRHLYDGNEKTSWEDGCWQPKELVVVG